MTTSVMTELRTAAHAEAVALRGPMPEPNTCTSFTALHVVCTCPRCGDALELVAPGAPSPGGSSIGIVMRCAGCRAQIVGRMTLSATTGQPVGRGSRVTPREDRV